jgi:large repetitive protein
MTLAEGVNTIITLTTDAQGNTSTVTRTVIVDTTPPVVRTTLDQTAFPLTNIRDMAITGTTDPGSTLVVTVNGKTVSSTIDPVTGKITASLSPLIP